jgi:hypothetical protein
MFFLNAQSYTKTDQFVSMYLKTEQDQQGTYNDIVRRVNLFFKIVKRK